MESVAERFWSKVKKTETCWIWTGGLRTAGYGQFAIRHRKIAQAHRVAYEMQVGPIPEGLYLDHLCRVRACVNPSHLEPVTHKENLARGAGAAVAKARYAAITHCLHGHEYTSANTILRIRNGYKCRVCATCERERGRLSWPARAARKRLAVPS